MALSAQAQQTAGNQRCPSGEVCPREAKNMTSCPLQIAALSRRHEKRGGVRAGECMSGGLRKPGLPVLAQPCGRQLELLGPTERESQPCCLGKEMRIQKVLPYLQPSAQEKPPVLSLGRRWFLEA